MLLIWLLAVGGGLAVPAGAVVFEPREFASPEHAARYKRLIDELRCLVCQNQNIADSNAPLAQDLRRETFRMVEEGRSEAEVKDFMVARYGDFVLYRPPLKGTTLALWAGPALLVLIGLVTLVRALRRRRRSAPEAPLSEEERARLDALVGRE
jgi:cytochrome c-type biogenesis protein CcmH